MDEYVLVCFDEDGRHVLADGGIAGLTNRVFVLPTGADPCPARCGPVLEEVTVVSVSSLDEGFGSSGQRQLVLGLADDQARGWFAAYGAVDSPSVTVVLRG